VALPLGIANGGTGAATLPNAQLLEGHGTGAITGVALPLPVASGGTGATVAKTRANFNTLHTISGVTSTTGVMCGWGATFTITPTVTGVVVMQILGGLINSVANGQTQIQLNYGTGTAPAANAAPTGTNLVPANVTGNSPSAGGYLPFTIAGMAVLTVGTTYWFDMVLSTPSGGGNCSAQATAYAVEI
jgi:hypothetical protein